MASRDGKPAVILLAEDNPADQEITRRALEEDVIKTELHVVPNGELALEFLRRQGAYVDSAKAPRPDLILLDLNMPRLDGKQVLREIRKDENLKRIPVVILTSSQQEEDIIRGYDLGCNSFITKPVEVDNFVQAIREIGAYWLELVALPSH